MLRTQLGKVSGAGLDITVSVCCFAFMAFPNVSFSFFFCVDCVSGKKTDEGPSRAPIPSHLNKVSGARGIVSDWSTATEKKKKF